MSNGGRRCRCDVRKRKRRGRRQRATGWCAVEACAGTHAHAHADTHTHTHTSFHHVGRDGIASPDSFPLFTSPTAKSRAAREGTVHGARAQQRCLNGGSSDSINIAGCRLGARCSAEPRVKEIIFRRQPGTNWSLENQTRVRHF